MARRIKDATLDSREARRKLAVRGKPYWRAVERGLHLGYRRRSDGAGRWIARHYLGSGKYEEEAIGGADDLSDPDGLAILDYWQAVDAARKSMKARAERAAGQTGPYTVADACRDYIDYLADNRSGGSAYDARKRLEEFVLPKLGGKLVADLTSDMLREWLRTLAAKPARLRSKSGGEQHYRAQGDDDDAVRRRRATANRHLATFKAALNHAWREEKVPSNAAWGRVKPFEDTVAARVRYLTTAQATRLLNACRADFRLLVRAALETGARYGELCRLIVEDFNPDAGTLSIRKSKSGKPRNVVLTEDGQEFFSQVCAGRAGAETMLRKADGTAWAKSHQQRLMLAACGRAKIDPPIGFHQLRHTWASLAVMEGVPLLIVAKQLGHRDTKMAEEFYAHLAPDFVADAIRAGAPRFGAVEKTNVEVLQ